jgi:hypothetical protein
LQVDHLTSPSGRISDGEGGGRHRLPGVHDVVQQEHIDVSDIIGGGIVVEPGHELASSQPAEVERLPVPGLARRFGIDEEGVCQVGVEVVEVAEAMGADANRLGMDQGVPALEAVRRLKDTELAGLIAAFFDDLVEDGRPGLLVEFDVAADLKERSQALVAVEEDSGFGQVQAGDERADGEVVLTGPVVDVRHQTIVAVEPTWARSLPTLNAADHLGRDAKNKAPGQRFR